MTKESALTQKLLALKQARKNYKDHVAKQQVGSSKDEERLYKLWENVAEELYYKIQDSLNSGKTVRLELQAMPQLRQIVIVGELHSTDQIYFRSNKEKPICDQGCCLADVKTIVAL